MWLLVAIYNTSSKTFTTYFACEWAIVIITAHFTEMHIGRSKNFPRSRGPFKAVRALLLYSSNRKHVRSLHIIIRGNGTREVFAWQTLGERESLDQLRVPIVTGVGVRWKMVRMSLPCESRWTCCASWAANNASSVAPDAPITEPTTPPTLLRSPVTCHVPIPAKIIYTILRWVSQRLDALGAHFSLHNMAKSAINNSLEIP